MSSIKLDLFRRDFTINTLAIRLDRDHYGELLDFYEGEQDLRNGLIRVPRDERNGYRLYGAAEIVRKSLEIAGEVCIYTNTRITVLELEEKED